MAHAGGIRYRKRDRLVVVSYGGPDAGQTVAVDFNIAPTIGEPYRRQVDFTLATDRTIVVSPELLLTDDQGGTIEGFIVRGTGTSTPPSQRGVAWFIVQLIRDGLVIQNLGQDYWTNMSSPSLGMFAKAGPGGGEGFMRQITLADPAAEVDAGLIDTVPTNALWLVHSIIGTLVASADAGSRQPRFQYRNASDVVIAAHAPWKPATAGQTKVFAAGLGNTGIVEDLGGGTHNIPLTHTYLTEGFDVFISTLNFDTVAAGDDWGAIQMRVEEWLVV